MLPSYVVSAFWIILHSCRNHKLKSTPEILENSARDPGNQHSLGGSALRISKTAKFGCELFQVTNPNRLFHKIYPPISTFSLISTGIFFKFSSNSSNTKNTVSIQAYATLKYLKTPVWRGWLAALTLVDKEKRRREKKSCVSERLYLLLPCSSVTHFIRSTYM